MRGRREKRGDFSGGGRTALRLILLCAGVILLAAGIFRGEVALVLTKAANICMECIGIG